MLCGCATETGSGEQGCVMAELGEVDVLLDGLQSDSAALREVSIQVGIHAMLLTYSLVLAYVTMQTTDVVY